MSKSPSHGGAQTAPNLAVNPNAVVEVTPLVRTESDLQCVGETRDESILEKKNKKNRWDLSWDVQKNTALIALKDRAES